MLEILALGLIFLVGLFALVALPFLLLGGLFKLVIMLILLPFVLYLGATGLSGMLQLESRLNLTEIQTIWSVIIFFLTPPDHQLPILYRYCQILFGKACNSQRDAVRPIRGLFDIEGGIAFVTGLCGPLQKPFQLLKPEQVGMRS